MRTKDEIMKAPYGEQGRLEVMIDIRDTLVSIRDLLQAKHDIDVRSLNDVREMMGPVVQPFHEAQQKRMAKEEADIPIEDIPEIKLVDIDSNLTMTMVSTVEQCRELTAPPCITGAPEGAPFAIPPDLEARDCGNCPIAKDYFAVPLDPEANETLRNAIERETKLAIEENKKYGVPTFCRHGTDLNVHRCPLCERPPRPEQPDDKVFRIDQ